MADIFDTLATGGSEPDIFDALAPATPPPTPESSGFLRRAIADPALGLLKGTIGLPEAALGVADIVTGGEAGKVAEGFGFRPKEAKQIIDTWASPELKQARANVAEAKGFLPKVGAMLENPSTIVEAATESAPSMIGGAGVARGFMKVAPAMSGVVAAGIGEGVVSAGQAAETIRQESGTGKLSPKQAVIATATGALTGALGIAGGKVATKLGIADVDAMLAQGGMAPDAIVKNKNLLRRVVEGAFSEGVLEELPQSAQEQVAQNLALGKPWNEGVAEAAASGMLVGGLMGVGANVRPVASTEKKVEDKITEILTEAVNPNTDTSISDVLENEEVKAAETAAAELTPSFIEKAIEDDKVREAQEEVRNAQIEAALNLPDETLTQPIPEELLAPETVAQKNFPEAYVDPETGEVLDEAVQTDPLAELKGFKTKEAAYKQIVKNKQKATHEAVLRESDGMMVIVPKAEEAVASEVPSEKPKKQRKVKGVQDVPQADLTTNQDTVAGEGFTEADLTNFHTRLKKEYNDAPGMKVLLGKTNDDIAHIKDEVDFYTDLDDVKAQEFSVQLPELQKTKAMLESLLEKAGSPVEYSALRELRNIGKPTNAAKVKQARPHLVSIAQGVFDAGAKTYKAFTDGMKKALGNLWENFKADARWLWAQVQKDVSDIKEDVTELVKGKKGIDYATKKISFSDSGLESDAVKDAAPSKIKGLTQADVKTLQGRGAKSGATLIPVEVIGENGKTLRAVAGVFGLRVVFFRQEAQEAGLHTEGNPNAPGGFIASDRPGVIFLNTESTTNLNFTLGHEVAHTMSFKDKAAYIKMADNLVSVVDKNKLAEYTSRLSKIENYKGADAVSLYDEFVADVVGEFFVDPIMWDKLATEQPSTFKKVADAVLKVFAKLKEVFTPDPSSLSVITDVNKAEAIVTEALKKYAENKKGVEYSITKPSGLKAAEITKNIKLSKIPLDVFQSTTDAPPHIRSDFSKRGLNPEAYFDHSTSRIGIIADNVASLERVQELLRHEWFHAGAVDTELGDIYTYAKKEASEELDRIAKERGFDLATRDGQLRAAGEYAAQLAESDPKNSLLQRLLVKVREWLRSLGLRVDFKQSDVHDLIQKAIGRTQLTEMGGVDYSAALAEKLKPFYSQLEKALVKMGGRMPVDQLRKMLKSNQVTDAEIENLIGGLSGVVTKQQVLDEIKANSVELKDVVLGQDTPPKIKGAYSQNKETGKWEVYDNFDAEEPAAIFDTMQEADAAVRSTPALPTHFSQYTEPGGPLSRDTEILTDKGWKRIDEAQIGDIVLTRKDIEGVIEWAPIEATPRVFAENLYHFKNGGVDMQVTAQHQMVVAKRYKRGGKHPVVRMTAERLWGECNASIPLTAINSQPHQTLLFGLPAGDALEFYGWFLAEGSCSIKNGNKSTVSIAQSRDKNPEKCARLEALFDRLGFKWNYVSSGPAYYVGKKSMPIDFAEFIYMQRTSKFKFIPKSFFYKDAATLQRLYEGMMLGDGSTYVSTDESFKPRDRYISASKQLADDFQVLCLLVGKCARVHNRKGLYHVDVKHNQWCTVDAAKHAIVPYNDYAFCVTVKNHAIYVRRHGVAAFTGNSNYREMFVTAPSKDVSFEEWQKMLADRTHGSPMTLRLPLNEQKRVFERAKELKALPNNWQDGHSQYQDIQNPIVRIRFNEREAEGRKILFVEEMQGPSDANQSKMPEYLRKRIYDLGVKRVLAYAKENGFDGVAWTPGEMQAKRYDLSKQVERINWFTDFEDGDTKKVEIVPANGTRMVSFPVDSAGVVTDGRYQGEKLEAVVGKEIGKQIIESEDGRLEGLDLKVGGEGLKSLYDKTLPALFKKYGKEGVEKTQITTNRGEPEYRVTVDGGEFQDVVTIAEAEDIADRTGGVISERSVPTQVPYTPITQNTPASYPMYSTKKEAQEAVTKIYSNAFTLKEGIKTTGTQLFRKIFPEDRIIKGALALQKFKPIHTQLKALSELHNRMTGAATDIDHKAHTYVAEYRKEINTSDLEKNASLLAFKETLYQLNADLPVEMQLVKDGEDTFKAPNTAIAMAQTKEEAYQEVRDLRKGFTPAQLQAVRNFQRHIKETDNLQLQAMKEANNNLFGSDSETAKKLNERVDSVMRLQGHYMPLTRFGDIFVRVFDEQGGERVAMMSFESRDAAAEYVQQMRKEGKYAELSVKQQSDTHAINIPASFQDQIQKAAQAQGLEGKQLEAFMDAYKQQWLATLPNTTLRVNEAHRSAVAGFDMNLLRVYEHQMQKYSRAMPKAKYGVAVEQTFRDMRNKIKEVAEGVESDPFTTQELYELHDTLYDRANSTTGEKIHEVVKTINKFVFMNYLAAPSTYVVQWSQPFMITLPQLLSRHGLKAISTFNRAAKETISGMYSDKKIQDFDTEKGLVGQRFLDLMDAARMEPDAGKAAAMRKQVNDDFKKLTPAEQDLVAQKLMILRGGNDLAFSHELADDVAGSSKSERALNKVVEYGGWFMRKAETGSRRATNIAAFRLEFDRTKDVTAASDYAMQVIDDTLYNFGSENRPSWMQGNAGRLIGMFRYFQLHTVAKEWQLMKDAIGREFDKEIAAATTPAEKAAALEKKIQSRKELAWQMGITFTLAGAAGTPLTMLVSNTVTDAVWSALSMMFGDDDDPTDLKDMAKQASSEMFGDDATNLLGKGVFALAGLDVSRRIGMGGMGNLFSGDPPPGITGTRRAEWYASRLLGPAWGMVSDQTRAIDALDKGDVGKALQYSSPKIFKDMLKAYDVGENGVSSSGMVILKPEDVSAYDLALQFVGINPMEVSLAREESMHLTRISTLLSQRRSKLVGDLAKATIEGDVEAREDAIEKINKFSETNPKLGITAKELVSGIQKERKSRAGTLTPRERLIKDSY